MTEIHPNHKAGFVSIVGKPNAGKSTLMNALVGEKISIVTPKAQTTRHRIMGILNAPEYQIVYSDTPGIMKPEYKLQESMMKFINFSLEDADALLWVVDIRDPNTDEDLLIDRVRKMSDKIPVYLCLNKIDTSTQPQVEAKMEYWKAMGIFREVILMSALEKFNTQRVLDVVLEVIPVHPPFYDKEDLTDKTERFIASEIIREKIFENYTQEIPYSSQVAIIQFKDEKNIVKISADIYVERDSQKGILIGQNGAALKKVATSARIDMETFFGKKVFLETHVRVEPNWRSKVNSLKKFGYED